MSMFLNWFLGTVGVVSGLVFTLVFILLVLLVISEIIENNKNKGGK